VTGVRSAAGILIAAEGGVASLSAEAIGLADAYVFPNPVNPGQSSLVIGGLPYGAAVDILTAAGSLVQTLRETTGTGGVRWDLTDKRGEQVASGVYLLRVTISGEDGRLLKAAIIR